MVPAVGSGAQSSWLRMGAGSTGLEGLNPGLPTKVMRVVAMVLTLTRSSRLATCRILAIDCRPSCRFRTGARIGSVADLATVNRKGRGAK